MGTEKKNNFRMFRSWQNSFLCPRLMNTFDCLASKIMMSLLYFAIFTPIASVLRLAGKDLLHKKMDRSAKSYWIEREKQPESMKNQF